VSSSDENLTVEMYAKRNRSWRVRLRKQGGEKKIPNKPMGYIVTGGIEFNEQKWGAWARASSCAGKCI